MTERAKAESPDELRRRIRQLEAKLKKQTGVDALALALARKEGAEIATDHLQPELGKLENIIADAQLILGQVGKGTLTLQRKGQAPETFPGTAGRRQKEKAARTGS